jgi:excisionase family DNA binding protein
LNKKAAAQFLNVSERAIERYTKAGRLTARYEKGKTRSVAVYDEAELRTLKREIDNPSVIRPRIEPPLSDNQTQALTTTNSEQALSPFVANSNAHKMLAAFEAIAAPVRLSEKILLSIPEAATLSGIPADKLRAAVKSGALKALSSIGRGLGKVRRSDLDAYVSKLK